MSTGTIDTTPHPISEKIRLARTLGELAPEKHQVPYRNIGELLRQRVQENPAKAWMVYYSDEKGRREYSYGEFYGLVCRTANLLLDLGVGRGDRIATVAYNHSDTVVQYFAAFLIGAVVVPINVGEDDKRISYILQHSRTKLVFVREQYTDRLRHIIGEHPGVDLLVNVCEADSPGRQRNDCLDYLSEIQKRTDDYPAHILEPNLEDEALIVYTSGTTGLPKGVVLTQYNLLVDARALAEWHGLTPEHRMMCVLPIHHVNGTIVTLMTPLYSGGSVVLNQKFHSHKFFERVAAEHVNIVSVVPTLLQFLLHEDTDLSQYDLRPLQRIICGAGPLTVELALQFEDRFNIPIIHGYGLSETTCYSSHLPVDLSAEEHRHWLKDYGFPSIGVPLPVNEMAIHDPNGNPLEEEVKGEIVIRGHNVMKEYFGSQEANEKAFTFGWFRSGDEGFYRVDALGRKYFFITGRIKELIIRGGVNISPFEIDEVLMNMPGVKAGLAVAFDNDWYGEEVGAYVQPAEGAAVTPEDVIAYCRGHFPYSKCPKVVLFGNDIPVTSTGKYQRNKLKPLFGEFKTVQFKEKHKE